ncbi:MAG TPA: ATP-binding protein [Blastocatellia bacterium]|nr:ATP-binding protein [Blastocatellia bacterium]
MINDKALLSEYLSESEELLDSLLSDLDSLASSPSEPDTNLINRVFRTVHSLKGLSGMMDLAEVQSLAHQIEDILDELRLGHITSDPDLAAGLQEAGAGLAALVGGAVRGTATDEDFDRLRELLTSITRLARSRSRKEASSTESIGLSDRERSLLTEYEQHRINENFKAGRTFYSIYVQFEVTILDSQYRALTSRLEEIGELITTLPDTASETLAVAFKLILATHIKEPDIKRILDPYGARVARMTRSPWRRAGEALRAVGRKKASQEERDVKGAAALLPPAFAQESLQPLSPSVRVELSQIDELSGLAHELAIEVQRIASMADRFLQVAGFGAKEQFDLRFSARRIEREFIELEERLVELRMVSLAQTFTRAARLAGRLARELGKSVTVELAGRETQLDKMIVDRVADPLYHILRNALDHGIETPDKRRLAGKRARGRVKIGASLEGTRAIITIEDDGRGIDPAEVRRRSAQIGATSEGEELTEEETLRLIFRPGFSTAGQVSAVSGRGVGLDAVERTIHELGGEIRLRSQKGVGTIFELAVPTTLVMISSFIVRVSDWRYAINVGQINELLYVDPSDVLGRDGRRSIVWQGSQIPMVELKFLLGLGGARVFHQPEWAAVGFPGVHQQGGNGSAQRSRVPIFVTRSGEKPVAVAVEEFEEQREIIVKSLGPHGRKIKGVVGAVDLEGGDVALVLDLPSLLMHRSLRV